MAEHTPGPWQASAMYQEGVYTVRMGSFSVHGLCGEANARLIAAAPELLASCNALVGLIQIVCARDDIPLVIRGALLTSHRLDEAQSAVAKARGSK